MPPSHFSHRPPRTWIKISIQVPKKISGTVASFLGTLAGSGVEQIPCSDSDGPTSDEKIIGYIEDNKERPSRERKITAFVDRLQKNSPQLPPPGLHTELIVEEDWGEKWKKHFKPIHITRNTVICPTWETYTPQPDEYVIKMDPGMAFGTGHHASTRLAIELIEEAITKDHPPESVLDLGTGTGILAITCALHGAKRVIALDNDPDAIAAAGENVQLNGFNKVIDVQEKPLEKITRNFDLIVANITHDVLTALAPSISNLLADQGKIILAGILSGSQTVSVAARYKKLGLTSRKQLSQGEWSSLFMTKGSFPQLK